MGAELRVDDDGLAARPVPASEFCRAKNLLKACREVNRAVPVDAHLPLGALKVGRLHGEGRDPTLLVPLDDALVALVPGHRASSVLMLMSHFVGPVDCAAVTTLATSGPCSSTGWGQAMSAVALKSAGRFRSALSASLRGV